MSNVNYGWGLLVHLNLVDWKTHFSILQGLPSLTSWPGYIFQISVVFTVVDGCVFLAGVSISRVVVVMLI